MGNRSSRRTTLKPFQDGPPPRGKLRQRNASDTSALAASSSTRSPSKRASSRAHARHAAALHPEAYIPAVEPSVLHRLQVAYRKGTHEIGYHTDGHKCVTQADMLVAKQRGSSLLYGEVLPSSVVKMLDRNHLDASSASVLYDLGSGTGKLALQAFLMYPNLVDVVGVELCHSRFLLGEKAVLQLASSFPADFAVVDWTQGHTITLASTQSTRHLTLRFGDLLETPKIKQADIIIIQTDLPSVVHRPLVQLLNAQSIKTGCRMLSYLNLHDVWASIGAPFPFVQHRINRSPHDRFLTSWSYVHGHHFYVWQHAPLRVPAPQQEPPEVDASQVPGASAPSGEAPSLPAPEPDLASLVGSQSQDDGDMQDPLARQPSMSPPGVIDDSTTTNVEALDDEPPAAAESYLIAPFAPVTKGRAVSVAGSDSDDVSPPQSPYERARSCRSSGVSSRRASEDPDRSPHASRQSSPATASVRGGGSVAVSGAGSTASCVDASLDAYSSASAPTLAPATGVGSIHGDAVSDAIPVTPVPAVGDASGEGLAALDTGSVAMSGRPLDVVGGEVAGELSSPSFFRRTQQRVSSLLGRQPEV